MYRILRGSEQATSAAMVLPLGKKHSGDSVCGGGGEQSCHFQERILQWRRVVLKSMEWASRLGRRGKCKERKKITTWV